jgi:hypothetical protein
MLIGLHGLAGAGKDTVAQRLYDAHDYTRMAFAQPVKDMLIALGVPRANLTDPGLKAEHIDWIGKTPRLLMQTLGTEWGRGLVDSELWLRHAERRLKQYRKISPHIVVTDVRFDNEARWLHTQGGRLWHIRRGYAGSTDTHSSEAGLAIGQDDIVIFNDADVTALHDKVDRAISMTRA